LKRGGELVERRNLFRMVFGSKKEPTVSGYELISSSSASFQAWDGNVFANDIVRSCIRPKANAIGKMNAVHIRGTTESLRISPSPWIKRILERPNPYMSMQDFLSKMVTFRELSHNAFAYVVRDQEGRFPVAIYPMPYSSIDVVGVNSEMFIKFRFNTGKSVVVPYADCVHLRKDFNSSDIFGDTGIDALSALMNIITTTDQGIVYAIKNSAAVRWLLKFKTMLQPADRALQVKEFVDNYLAVTNNGGAAASDPRYDVEQVKSDNYVPNAIQMNSAVNRLYAYFGVNESIVQNKYDENQYTAFYESELEPIAIQLSNAFTEIFFTEREKSTGNKIVFESSNLAYASMSTKLALVAMVDRGALTPNEWRKVLNLAPINGGDEPIRRLDTQTVNKTEGGNADAGTTDKSA